MSGNFTIIITTFNRCEALKFTLSYFQDYYAEIPIFVCDDASTDGTSRMIKDSFPQVKLITNTENKGLIHNRNLLLEQVQTQFVISIDDDAHFLTENNLNKIRRYFQEKPRCAVVSFRIFWGLESPRSISTNQKPYEVAEYAGGAHAMRMSAWRDIPSYPAWYTFYGEEQFASLQFYKKQWEVHYFPDVLVHHRVDVKARKKGKDYITRTRRALHASWSNYLIFYPLATLPRKFAYSLYRQIRLKVFKGDLKAAVAILGALGMLLWNTPKWFKSRNALTKQELENYNSLPKLNLYWTPEKDTL